MKKTTCKILRPDAWENIQSVTGIVVDKDTTTEEKQFIDENTPITASFLNGSYTNIFKDDIWKISESKQINFSTGVESLNIDEVLEIKTLSYLFLEIPFARAQGLYKSLLSPQSVFIRASTLKALKKTTTLKDKTLVSLFADVEVANALAKEIQQAEKAKTPGFSLIITNLQALLTHVRYLSINYLNITPAYSENLEKTLAAAYKRARAISEQHTVIPPIIYEKIYSDAIDIIKKWNFKNFDKDAKNLISAYTNLGETGSNSNKQAGVSRKAYQGRLAKFLNHEEKIYDRPGNFEYFKNKIKSVGQVEPTSFFYGSKDMTGITFEVRRVQAYLARLILLESTMRENELIHLLNEPTKIITTSKGTVYQVLGTETKIHGGKRVGWVISKNGHIAHKILRQLSDFSYQIHIKNSELPKWLFPRLSCALVDKSSKNIVGELTTSDGRTIYYTVVDDKPITNTSLFKYKETDFKDKETGEKIKGRWLDRTGGYTLSDADVNFLQTYSSLDNRLNDNVQPGQVFSITEHQFRRSLPFYASGTGLLSVADLKHQLKHTSIISSFYYADGGRALQASGLLLDDETYKEMNEYAIKNIDQTDTILRKELIKTMDSSKHTLFGPGLKAVKQFTESIKQSQNPNKEWADLAKEGAIKTKELPHGWCITTKPCDDFANQNFSECFNCANGVLDQDKSIALISNIKNQAKSARNDSNKRNFTNLAKRVEDAAFKMYPNLFKDQ
ncbi:MAG: hypothetical protein GQ532_02365 [Methylomarinum sp.]|nr:hypothetical protein [Methylomarinum sp.]